MRRLILFIVMIMGLLGVNACTPLSDSNSQNQSNSFTKNQITSNRPSATAYIVHCELSCDHVEKEIRLIGGRVRQTYSNFNLLAFELTDTKKPLQSMLADYAVVRDKRIKSPAPVEMHTFVDENQLMSVSRLNASSTNALNQNVLNANDLNANDLTENSLAQVISTNSFSSNIVDTGVAELHQKNILGQHVIVAIIDSGTANNADVVPLLSGSVIGGENFVMNESDISATSTLNDPHGTWVGTMVAGHGAVQIEKQNPLAMALAVHAPQNFTVISDTHIEVLVTGTAPAARLYPFKVFPADGSGAPSSRVIAAMDRALTLKKNFTAGMSTEPVAGDGSEENPFVYDALNIQVVNMSLGGPSLFPGFEIDDIITDEMLNAGIVVVTAAGNEGFAAMTGGSPGTGIGSISVGASNDATHERIFREVVLGEGMGSQFRPTEHPQIAPFSSRGPTADGRTGVDLVANGRAVFVQGADGKMRLVSGTSFSSPTVAGAAALLWSEVNSMPPLPVPLIPFSFEINMAKNIRTALIEGAESAYFLNGTTKFDQGHGLLDVDEALDMLEDAPLGMINSHLPTKPLAESNTKVADNLLAQGIPIFRLGGIKYEADINLIPGQVHQIFVETDKNTHSIVIEIDDVVMQLPTDQQNVLFGDEFILTVADAILSVDDILLQALVLESQTFTVSHVQPGLVRVAIMGDWTNVGNASAEISVTRLTEVPPLPTLSGVINDGETTVHQFDIDSNVTSLSFGLSWNNNWAYYPSHDLDIIVIDPNGDVYFDGASLHSPEKFSIEAPAAGTWTVHVDGFLLHNQTENYQLFVSDQNGVPMLSVN